MSPSGSDPSLAVPFPSTGCKSLPMRQIIVGNPQNCGTTIRELDEAIDYLDRLAATVDEIAVPRWLYARLMTAATGTYRGKKIVPGDNDRVVIDYHLGAVPSRLRRPSLISILAGVNWLWSELYLSPLVEILA